jgi:hypothetical protein
MDRLNSLAVRVLASTAVLAVAVATAQPAAAALQRATGGGKVIFGADDDNTDNPAIQPGGAPANQSLNDTDVMIGGGGTDILIGKAGSDVMDGRGGDDVIVGGTEQGAAPNSDIMFGGTGNDVALWRGGDGSEAFIGGPGLRDAEVFGNIDRDANNVPVVSDPVRNHPTGVPTADVTGQGGFCTLEAAPPDSGYEFLVRFFIRATGALAVTVRLAEVEQVFCTSQAGGQITFADLRAANPAFVVVTKDEVDELNPDVGRIIR